MLIVRCHVALSDIDGFGLFASEYIQEGQVIRVHHPKLDTVLSAQEFARLPVATQLEVDKHSWLDKAGNHHVSSGYEIFTNHSTDPNTAPGYNEGEMMAVRDIHPGEEITEDYRITSARDPSRPWLNG